MAVIGGVLVAVGLAGAICGVWVLICNERTYAQRARLIGWTFEPDAQDSEWRKRASVYEGVSYDQHLFHVATFRDPMNLYRPFAEQRGVALPERI